MVLTQIAVARSMSLSPQGHEDHEGHEKQLWHRDRPREAHRISQGGSETVRSPRALTASLSPRENWLLRFASVLKLRGSVSLCEDHFVFFGLKRQRGFVAQ